MKPIIVNQALPAETCGEMPARVRIRPWMSHGCRPISAVIQPAVVAMYGNGKQSMSTQSMAREV